MHRSSKVCIDFAKGFFFFALTAFDTYGVADTTALLLIQDLRSSDFPWLALIRC